VGDGIHGGVSDARRSTNAPSTGKIEPTWQQCRAKDRR
jgi:hypothetical protein